MIEDLYLCLFLLYFSPLKYIILSHISRRVLIRKILVNDPTIVISEIKVRDDSSNDEVLSSSLLQSH